jgi:hypothetical protein
MIAAQLNLLCAAYQNVDRLGLDTGDPGVSGASNDSGIPKATLTWSTPANGVMTATANFNDIDGTFTHITLWDGSVFIEAKPRAITLADTTDLTVAVEHKVTA